MRKKVFWLILALVLLIAVSAGAEKLGEKKLGEEFKITVKAKTEDAIVVTIRSNYDREVFEFVSGKSKYGHWGKNGASLINLLEPLDGEIGVLTFKILEDAIPGEYTFKFQVTGAYTLEEEKATMKIPNYTIVVLDTLEANPERIAAFLSGCYSQLLGRDIDEEGLAFWSAALTDRTANASDVINLILSSDEYQSLGQNAEDAVEGLYEAMLSRPSDEEGKAGWVAMITDGCSPKKVVGGFCDSVEFQRLCLECGIRPGHPEMTENRDVNTSLTAFVTRCYRVALQRDPDIDGLNSWCGFLLDGSMTPSQVADGFIFSEELLGQNQSSEEAVRTLYRLYLDRDADPDGLAFWLENLQSGAMTLSDISAGFAGSDEFAALTSGLQ